MTDRSFYWHDYETFGTHPRQDFPAQFAGLRTDEALNPVGEPLVVYCQPPNDYLPQVDACLVTGITPQIALEKGLKESHFAACIHEQLASPMTCTVGYNSIRFDDEFTRNLLFRNFYDPYEREYRNGNSRWDLIDAVRLCYALRPQGMQWPEHEPGRPSFRLEDLTQANGIEHGQAHDALSDVRATIALAQRLRAVQPRLFDWALSMRGKPKALSLLDFARLSPVIHVSSKYPAERGCLALVAPLCPHPVNRNGVIVMDLAFDPSPLSDLSAETISERVFTAASELPEGIDRIPLKVVHANRSPMLAPISVLRGVDTARIGLDVDQCLLHLGKLKEIGGLSDRIQSVFSPIEHQPVDVDASLYDGFIADEDRARFPSIRNASPERLSGFSASLRDPRMPELLFRYRARQFPETLSPDEHATWREHRRSRLLVPDQQGQTAMGRLHARIELMRAERGKDVLSILDQLSRYADDLVKDLIGN